MPDTLAIFAKQPLPVHAKSRLAQATTPAWASAVAQAFLDDVLERYAALAVERLLLFAPPAAHAFFTSLAGARYRCVPQAPGDLGQRLAAFAAQTSERFVLLGTDSPTLPVAWVEEAFARLAHADVVLGPAADGGYYLLGCRQAWPALFADIAWSSADVLAQTVARIRAAGLTLQLLPPWYDIDTLDDWRLLCGHLAALRLAGLDPQAPRTEQLAAAPVPGGPP